MSLNYISRDDEVIVVLNNVPYVIYSEDHRYWDVMKAIADKDEKALYDKLSLVTRANNMHVELAEEGFEKTDDGYTYLGNPIAMDLGSYFRAALNGGTWPSVVAFIKRLFDNPSNDTRQRLFGFMETNKLPIRSDGTFLAFKVVTENYLDKHTKSVDNTPGTEVPRFPWAQVDTDPNNTCSRGYHACSKEYLSSFYCPGDRIVSVAVGPEDVGAIPSDYNNSKLRCRGYKVISDITDDTVKDFESARIKQGLSPDNYDDEDDIWGDYY